MKRKKDKQYRKLTKRVDKELKKISKKKKDRKSVQKEIQCKHCDFTIVFKGTQREHFTCPFCKKELSVSFLDEKPILKEEEKKEKKEKKTKVKKTKKLKFSFVALKIIEIIIILAGIYYLRYPTLENIKISFSLILIGTILLFLISDKTKSDREKTPLKDKPSNKLFKNKSNFLSLKIAIILIVWILILFFLTGSTDVEIYFIFVFIGILIARELTDNLASKPLKHRLNVFIVIFLLAYIVIIFDKIKDILDL